MISLHTVMIVRKGERHSDERVITMKEPADEACWLSVVLLLYERCLTCLLKVTAGEG